MNRDPRERVTRALDERARDLDGNTLSRLHQARTRALADQTRRHRNGFQAILLGGASVAAVALVGVLLLRPPGDKPLPLELSGEAWDIATLSVDLEVIEELDFYEWLSLQDLQAVAEREST